MNVKRDLFLRRLIQRMYEVIWQYLAKPIKPSDLSRSAIVFAPHQDDETLACGGTIIQKKRCGASVQIVYLTDGSGSHPDLIDPQRLSQIREQEAISALELLGVAVEDVTFLRFPDGQLQSYAEAAIAQITQTLSKHQPAEIFIPHHQEPNDIPDHAAANRIIRAAVQRAGVMPVIYEYPVWLWDHYPWVGYKREWRGRFRRYKALQKNLRRSCRMGWTLLRDFHYSVKIQDELDLKHKALTQYKSQTTQYVADSRWQTITDFSNGDFFRCFLRNQELFCRRS